MRDLDEKSKKRPNLRDTIGKTKVDALTHVEHDKSMCDSETEQSRLERLCEHQCVTRVISDNGTIDKGVEKFGRNFGRAGPIYTEILKILAKRG